jgi:hypothetical protein
MSGVFQNIDLPSPHRPASVYHPAFGGVRGEDTLAGWREDRGSIFWKTPDTALYSTYFVGPTVYTLLMRYELQLNFPPSGGKNWFINRRFLSLLTPLNVLIFQKCCLAYFRERKGQNGNENRFASKRQLGDLFAYFAWKRNSPHLKRSDEI